MFFPLSKILLFLIDPIFWVFVLLVYLLWNIRGKVALQGGIAFMLLWLLASPWVGAGLLGSLERLLPPKPLAANYEAAILLTGMLHHGIKETPAWGEATDRVLVAARLLQQGRVKHILITGRSGKAPADALGEAEILKTWLEETWGFDPKQILVERSARNRAENAILSKPIIEKQGWKKLLLITSAFHSYRAVGCFQNQGIRLDYIHTDYRVPLDSFTLGSLIPSHLALAQSALAIHEYTGILVYGLLGKANY